MAASIRLLGPGDLRDALTLSSTAGWNQRVDDWAMLTRQAPAGSFGAFEDGYLRGTAIGLDYGAFGWIAMMLVDPACRGKGLGHALLEAAMGAIPADRPIRLDATPMGRPLYQRHGFVDETTLTRHVRESAAAGATAHTAGAVKVRPMTSADLAAVQDSDRAVTGAQRPAVVEWLLASGPHLAFGVERPGPPQYVLGRSGRLFTQIGPVVAREVTDAVALVRAAAAACESGAAVIDAFEANPGFLASIRALGFEPQRPLFRMCRPTAGGRWCQAAADRREFAIVGPEFS